MDLFELNDIEIFRTGEWNGDRYSTKDLDDMVDAFSKVGYKPPVKLGHREESGDPAYGFVKSIKRVGDKLVADFMDMQKEVFEAIKARKFDSVSSEIFWNIKRGEDKFRRALKAVALLGAEIPAVAGLKPLRDSFSIDNNASQWEVHGYNLTTEDFEMATNDKTIETLEAANKASADQIAELTQKLEAATKAAEANKNSDDSGSKEFSELQASVKTLTENLETKQKEINVINAARKEDHKQKVLSTLRVPAYAEFISPLFDLASDADPKHEYSVGTGKETKKYNAEGIAEQLIARINKDAEHLFKTLSKHDELEDDDVKPEDKAAAGKKLDLLTQKYMTDNKVDDYATAFKVVLHANPDLAELYD